MGDTPTNLQTQEGLTLGQARVLVDKQQIGTVFDVSVDKSVENLEHETKRSNLFVRNKVIPIREDWTLNWTAEEITPETMNLFMGDLNYSTEGDTFDTVNEAVWLHQNQWSDLSYTPAEGDSSTPQTVLDGSLEIDNSGASNDWCAKYYALAYRTDANTNAEQGPLGQVGSEICGSADSDQVIVDIDVSNLETESSDNGWTDSNIEIRLYKEVTNAGGSTPTSGIEDIRRVDDQSQVQESTQTLDQANNSTIRYTDGDSTGGSTGVGTNPGTTYSPGITVSWITGGSEETVTAVDYEIDWENGKIRISPDADNEWSDVNHAKAFLNYTTEKKNKAVMSLDGQDSTQYKEVEMIYEFEHDPESKFVFRFWKTNINTDISVAHTTDDWMNVPMTVETFSDERNHPNSMFGELEFFGPIAKLIQQDGFLDVNTDDANILNALGLQENRFSSRL